MRHLPKANTHLLDVDASQIEHIAQLLALAFENGSGLSQICNAEGDELRRRLRCLFRIGLLLQAAAKQQVLSIAQGDRVTLKSSCVFQISSVLGMIQL